ncbi:MAG: double-strand break repair helicase AddA [Paracoccaceae bacterium]
MSLDEATRNQNAAADPAMNTWLTANAGSGKTRVLTDRVARLLLGGADPLSILCLTYTKAAAAEMQNRLFKTLGGWAMAADDHLRASLVALGEAADGLSPLRLRKARQLFAKAIETPGGIRIQTIHSFCAALLRRFPLEAGVSPAFAEIDDRSALLLRDEILEAMALGPDAAALEGFLAHASGELGKQIGDIVSARARFAALPDVAGLRAALSLPDGLDETALLGRVFLGDEADLIAALLPRLAAGGVSDHRAAGRLAALLPLQETVSVLAEIEGIFLNGAGTKAPFSAKIGSFPTKAVRESLGPLQDRLEGLMRRVEAAREDRCRLALLRKTEALHRFAHAFLARYENAKARRGWLDFDDLVTLATGLLTDPSLSAWVLYRLDGGIAHVLVDEAQDTSPEQWKLIRLLTAEFTAGEGSHKTPRTLFVVGDKKQSIYSFQGADVAAFDGMHASFRQAFEDAGQALTERPLFHSFRSSPAILRLVDLAFRGDRQTAMGGALHHAAFQETLPGRVDFWPLVEKPEAGDRGLWFQPEDLTGHPGAETVLARQIAAEIRAMIDRGERITDQGQLRPVHEGDFLILLRRRRELFREVIRACKAEGLQVAGADRLVLTEELAVRDILALLAFLDTQDDDLALASALRSPLFGLSEDRLYRLAQGRPGVLWERLRQDETLADVRAVLDDLRGQAEFLRPFELIDRILTRHDGRRKLLGRLGQEASDAVDELLSQALAYERVGVPSLTGFLVWMASGDVEAKRQAESGGRLIRVMTVHGAKGLEAPIVILPDTADRRPPQESSIVLPAGAPPIWALVRDDATALQAAAQAERAEKREAESLRLLYVAVTRARCWLIVAAAGKAGDSSWYGMLRAAGEDLPLLPASAGRLRHEFGLWQPPLPQAETAPPVEPAPDWALHPAPAAAPAVRVLSPSDLGGDKTLPGETAGDPDALARGVLLHALLERFPALDAAGQDRVAAAMGAPDAEVALVRGLLAAPDLAGVFAPDALVEVGLSVPWRGHLLSGTIDRLVVGPDRVLVVDYKSNAAVPASPAQVPEGYLRQMGAYAHAMAQLYPGRRIELAILWTQPQLMRLDADIVRQALERAATA